MLHWLSDANRLLRFLEEGIEEAREALEISERLGGNVVQARCLKQLGRLLSEDEQLDAAEVAVRRAIDLFLENGGEEHSVCQCHRALGSIYRSTGEREKATYHLELALGMASACN